MRKLNIGTVMALGAMLVAFGPATPANAAKPHQDPPFTLSAAVCGFPILVQIPADGEKSTTTTLADGTTVTTIEGVFKEVLTNTVTGKTISVNASGRERLLKHRDPRCWRSPRVAWPPLM
jgi:hypothetical protein